MKVALEESGASAIVAATVAEAIEILAQSQPDILVSDIGMPIEDGYSLIHKIRASESGTTLRLRMTRTAKRLPAVALTAYASETDRTMALAEGYDEHLTKPIELALFAAVLAKISLSRNSF